MEEHPQQQQEQDTQDKPMRSMRGRPSHRRRRGRRMLVSTAALPALLTIMNGLSGFASIHFATKSALGQADPRNLSIAGWLIVAGMVFDMLDGRVARITRKVSEFGEQLDSLCDMITFGVAPAMLMVQTVLMVLRGHIDRIDIMPGSGLGVERVIWCLAALYVACTALRLARFNVETDPDESSHMAFRGLPSPAAAGAIVALVMLFADFEAEQTGWRSQPFALATVSVTLPLMTLLVALLMVSSIAYPHLFNQYMRTKRPFGFIVKLVLVILAAVLALFTTAAVAAVAYVLSGPVRHFWLARKKARQG